MKSSRNDVVYRTLCEEEIALPLFSDFSRRQVVNFCLRRTDGVWREEAAPFVDDWSLEDYRFLAACLRRTIQKGGVVYGAFADGALKGFVSVEAEPLGKMGNYRDLTSIHVSEEARRKGIGKKLFLLAKAWAAKQGAEKPGVLSCDGMQGRRRDHCRTRKKRTARPPTRMRRWGRR